MSKLPSFDPQAFKDFERNGWDKVAENYQDAFAAMTVQAVTPMLEAVGTAQGT